MKSHVALTLFVALVTIACSPDLGACDLEAARAPIYYDEDGFPAYPGQALLEVSCGAGSFCHTQGIPAEDRFGAPAGLDLDVAVAVEPDEVEGRLRHARRVAWNLRRDVIGQVQAGAMPPPTAAGETALGAGARYRAHRGTPDERPLPGIHTPEGIAMLRNWLACGAHVIEATEGTSRGVGDIVPRAEPSNCPEGFASCDGSCIAVTADPDNCGACGRACGADQRCVEGACACLNGLEACGAECVDLATDNANCGSCGTSCGARFCAGGACVDECPAGTTDCGGSCADLATSLAHCGGCGAQCAAGQACSGGTCACASGFSACGSACVDLSRDAMNCGACGVECAPSAACVSSTCTCASPTQDCGGVCVDTSRDPSHCGACGRACATGEACTGGSCVGCGPVVGFAQHVEPLLADRCASSGCHSGARPSASLSLVVGRSYDELVDVPSSCRGLPLVAPGEVSRSYLWNKLTGVEMCSGTLMPKRDQSLATAELEIIRSWICRGAARD